MPAKERKIAIMGFRSVGKSSLTIQFVEGMFVDSYDPTIEDTFERSYTSPRGQEYKLQLIDTAGQDEYSLFPTNYAMNINGYVLVFSVNSRKSFEIVQIIHEKILDQTGKQGVPCVIVGNKADLRMERVVTAEEGKALAEKWGAKYVDASAKENQYVNDVFDGIIQQIEMAEGSTSAKGCLIS
ncbi:GTP-binding protein Rheb-like [Watersipora subatra]|uniref:GTP-binding protein Rheb-like n=1 Tax=Watersipora subatra TaxID=2589382 RepID=UPI00355C7A78